MTPPSEKLAGSLDLLRSLQERWMTDRVFELACEQAGAAAATTRSAP